MNNIDQNFFNEHPEISEYYRPPQLEGEGQGDTIYVNLDRESGFIFRDEFARQYLGKEEEQRIDNAFKEYGWCEVDIDKLRPAYWKEA